MAAAAAARRAPPRGAASGAGPMRRGAHSRASGARPSAWRGSSARASLLDGLEPREVGLALGPCKDPPLVVPPVLALHRGSRRASDVMDPESALERRAADRRHVEDRAVRLAVRLGVQHEPRREEGGRGGGRLPATRRRLLAAPHHAASSRRERATRTLACSKVVIDLADPADDVLMYNFDTHRVGRPQGHSGGPRHCMAETFGFWCHEKKNSALRKKRG